MKSLPINILLLTLVLSFYNIGCIHSKEKIVVTAFFVSPADMSQLDVEPRGYTPNCVQVRVRHSFCDSISMADIYFPNIGSGIAGMAADMLIFADMRVKNKTTWDKVSCLDLGKDEMRNKFIKDIAYSYSPGNDCTVGSGALTGKKHYAPALYTQCEKGNWYAIHKNGILQDTVCVYFDIDPSSFYVWTSKMPKTDEMGKKYVEVLPKEDPLDFYLFYYPSYKYYSCMIEPTHHLEFLFENIDDEHCILNGDTVMVRYYPNDSIAKERFSYAKEAVKSVGQFIGWNLLPKNLKIAVSSQEMEMTSASNTSNVVYSLAKCDTKNSYAINLVDHSMFYNETLLHECLHTCFTRKFKTNSFEDNFFKESTIEYIASVIFDCRKSNDSIFIKHEENIRDKYISDKQLKHLLRSEHEISVSCIDSLNTYWVYYDLMPLKLHNYAVANGGDRRFCQALIEYLNLQLSSKYTIGSFNAFMRKKGYKNVDAIFNLHHKF